VDQGGTGGLGRPQEYLTTPPTLVAIESHETLHLYISATTNVISTTIIIKRGESGTNHKI
jgi:hypothetical protein